MIFARQRGTTGKPPCVTPLSRYKPAPQLAIHAFFRSLLILLCHKILVRLGIPCVRMEILTRGGGLWVSNPRQAAANHGSPPMSRRSRRRWVMPIAPRRSDHIARGCCCRAIARASSRWRRASQPGRVQAAHQSLHHFVAKADWSDDAVLAAVRARVLPIIERRGPIRALIVDDTGMPKKGKHSVGRGAAVLRPARQAGQLPGRGEPVGGQRSRQPADRLSPVSAARVG